MTRRWTPRVAWASALVAASGLAASRGAAQTVTASVSSAVPVVSPADIDAAAAKIYYTALTVSMTGCNNDGNATTTRCTVWMSASPDIGSVGVINGKTLRWGTTQAGCTLDVRAGTQPSTADTPVLEVTEPVGGSASGSATIWVCITTAAMSWSSTPTSLTPTFYFGSGRR